ncbi:MAG: class I SAM-dependent methyltransferase [Candidatus Hodarchaeota archaeon]
MNKKDRGFDWASSFYDQTRKIPSSLLNQIIHVLNERINFSYKTRFLEVGVGTGRLVIPILMKTKHKMMVGIDISEEMVKKCLEKTKFDKDLYLLVCDGFNLPFSQKFDIILTSHVLHLVEEHFKFLNSLLDVLMLNGVYIYLEAYVNYQESIPFKIFYNKLEELGYYRFFKDDLIRREIMVYLTRRNWIYEEINLSARQEITIHNLVRFIRNRVFSHQRDIPEELYRSSLEYVFNEIEKKDINPLEKINIPAISRITIFRRKY